MWKFLKNLFKQRETERIIKFEYKEFKVTCKKNTGRFDWDMEIIAPFAIDSAEELSTQDIAEIFKEADKRINKKGE